MNENQNTELKFVLSLDGKNFTAVAHTSTATADKLTASIDKIAVSSAKVVKTNTAVVGSQTDLGSRLLKLQKHYDKLTKDSQDYERTAKRIVNIQRLLSKNTAQSVVQTKKLGGATGTTGYAMISMNRIIDDSAYGFVAVSNNISPMLDSFSLVARDAGGVAAGLKTMAKSLVGPLGIATAVSIVTSILTRYALSNRSASEETKSLTKESDELNSKIKKLEGSYKDLIEANKLYKDNIKNRITDNLTSIEDYQKKLNVLKSGGNLSDTERVNITDDITELQNEIEKLQEQLKNGEPSIQANILLLQKLGDAAFNAGAKGIKEFLKNEKISKEQFETLTNQLKQYENTAFAFFGGKKKGTLFDELDIAGQLEPEKDQIIKTNKVLVEFLKNLSGKGNNGKIFAEGSIGFLREEISKLNDEFEKTTSEEKRIKVKAVIEAKEIQLDKAVNPLVNVAFDEFDLINQDFDDLDKQIAEEDERHKMKMAQLQFEADAKAKYDKEELRNIEKKRREEQRLHDQRMDSLHNFGSVLTQISENEKSVLAQLGNMLQTAIEIYSAVNSVTNKESDSTIASFDILSSVLGFVGLFHKGGIAGSPQQKVAVDPKVFSNAEVYHTGGIAGVPAILNPDEIILTQEMQKNLLGILASNQISLSKSSSSGVVKHEVTGKWSFEGNRFVNQIDAARSRNNRMARTISGT